MAKATITLYGEFIPWQDSNVEQWGAVNLKSVADQIKNAGDAEELEVRIHSNGGDVNEGFAIHDLLVNSGKKITTIIDGNCYSIATVAFMAGSTRYISKNAEFMIHNPWGGAFGTAEELQKYTDQVKDAEERILNFYVSKTGGDKEQIKAMMDGETFIKADQAIELKFATEIMQPVSASIRANFKATNTNNNKIMASAIEGLEKGLKSIMAKLGIKAEETTEPKAAMVKTDSGDELDVTMAGEKIAVGDTVKKDGEDYTGTATLEDGTVITCDAGKVTAVTEPSAEDSEEKKALKAENDQLKAKLDEQDTQLKALSTQMETITNHLKTVKTEFKVPGQNTTFNKKKEDVPVEKTVEQIKAAREARKEEYAKK